MSVARRVGVSRTRSSGLGGAAAVLAALGCKKSLSYLCLSKEPGVGVTRTRRRVADDARTRCAVLDGATAVRRVAVENLRDAALGCIGNSGRRKRTLLNME